MTQETNVLPGGYKLQEYCIESVLGTGGFGITYKARDGHLDILVAIKEYFPAEWSYRGRDGVTVNSNSQGQVIIPEVQTSGYEWGLDRFLDEARVLARVQHPYVVRVRRYFRANGTAYIVMDYEQGEPLSALLRRQSTLTETQLYGLLREVLPALEAVHQEGYLHRDLKPSNLYIRSRDGAVMLIDFGAARQSLSRRSKSVTGLVTPGYSPPEQYVTRSDHYGPWTDIYALGAVLYRCITGKPPIEAPDRQMWDTLTPAVEAGVGRYHPGLLAVVDRALAVRPADRFQTVKEMQEALSRTTGVDVTKIPVSGEAEPTPRESAVKPGTADLELTLSPLPTELASVDSPEALVVDLASEPAAVGAPIDKADSDAAPAEEDVLIDFGAVKDNPADGPPDGAPPEQAPARPARSGDSVILPPRPNYFRPPAATYGGGSASMQKVATESWDEQDSQAASALAQRDSGRQRDLILAATLVGLVLLLGAVAFKIYGDYQARAIADQREQEQQERQAVVLAAQNKARQEQEEARRQEALRYLQEARQAIVLRDWSKATAYVERADVLQPDNPRVTAVRAELLEAQHQSLLASDIWVDPKTSMRFVRVEGGCFAMGTPDSQPERYSNEIQHQVCLDSFWIGQQEVTNAQYRLFRPEHSSGSYRGASLDDDQQPVVEVDWDDAAAYARWLSQQSGKRYRLPTEAEWEYAARAGGSTARYWGNDATDACAYANGADKTAQLAWGATGIHDCVDQYAVAAPVASYAPNAYNLYDMLGNAAEWTCSEYRHSYDAEETRCSTAGPQKGQRTVRGGSWDDEPRLLRSSDRNGRAPDAQDNDLGFRLVMEK